MPPQRDPVAAKTKTVKKKSTPVPGQTGAGSGPSPAPKPRVVKKKTVAAAKAQEAQYASQGKAVEQVANQQKKVRRTAVNADRAQNIRITRAGLTPPLIKPEGGTALSAPSAKAPPSRPLAMLDVLNAQGTRFTPNDQVVRRQQQHTVDAGVAHLMQTGRKLHKQENTIERLRQVGALPGTSEFQKAVGRFNVNQANKQAERQKHLKQTPADLYLDNPKALKAAGFKAPGILDKIAQSPGEFTANAFKDAAELAATTPTSTYMLGKTAVTHPKKLPGMIAEPYKQAWKDPSVAFKRPVSTALMFAPVGKIPGLAAGKVLRIAGKQTLKGETRTLPGTALRQETRLSKDALKNAQQARAQRQAPTPTISDKEIRRRVDEHFEYRRKHVKRVEVSKGRELKTEAKALPKDQRAAFKAEELKGARGGAGVSNDRTFVREFGSHWQVDPKTGAVLKPKAATEGHLHPTPEAAQKVVERLKAAGHGEFAVKPVSESEFGVVPKAAAAQLQRHQVVGTGKATYAKVLRASRQKFTNAVLPTSPKWLSGQLVEGTIRTNIHAGGPVGVATGLLREHKVFKALEKERAGAGKEFRARALPGGHYGGQVQEFRNTPLHEIFNEADDGKIGEWLAKAGRAGEKTPGAKRVVNGWNRYTKLVFDQVNGRFIENTQQKAMLGRSLKDSPLMERKLLGLSNKAAQEAANGLRGTETQVEFGRAVQRAYGQYSNFSPLQRERNLHWTPFLPWYANALKFLTQVLPKDHPVLTSLLAAENVGTQKEREKLGLSTLGKGGKPLFMMGGIPVGGGKVIRIGHYTPWALGESKPSESIASLVVPQFSGTLKNLGGIDWKNEPLKSGPSFHPKPFNEWQTWARAGATQAEALIPGAGQVARITGLEDKLSGKNTPTVLSGKDLATALRKEVDPLMPTSSAAPKKKRKRKVAKKQHDILGGSTAGTVDILK